MNFEKLNERLMGLGTGYWGMFDQWLHNASYTNDERYNIIYGFIRGLAATSFLSSVEENELIDLLLERIYPKFEQVEV